MTFIKIETIEIPNKYTPVRTWRSYINFKRSHTLTLICIQKPIPTLVGHKLSQPHATQAKQPVTPCVCGGLSWNATRINAPYVKISFGEFT